MPRWITSRRTGEPCRSRSAARRNAPAGTVRIAKAIGGFLAFADIQAWRTWKRQK